MVTLVYSWSRQYIKGLLISSFLFLGSLLFSGQADSEKLKEEMERAKYDAEMKAVAEEEATKSQQQMSQDKEKIGIEKRIREGKDDKVFKVSSF